MERERELSDQPFAERVCRDELLELGYEAVRAPEGELGINALLKGRDPALLEVQRCSRGERFVLQVGQRDVVPLAERPGELLDCPAIVPGSKRGPTFLRATLEALKVEL